MVLVTVLIASLQPAKGIARQHNAKAVPINFFIVIPLSDFYCTQFAQKKKLPNSYTATEQLNINPILCGYLLFLVGFLTEIAGLLIYAKTIPSFLATNLHLPDEYELPFVS